MKQCIHVVPLLSAIAIAALLSYVAPLRFLAGEQPGKPKWDMVKTVELSGVTAKLSRPVLVHRSKGFLWFPTIMSLSNGEILAMLNDYADVVVSHPTAMVCWSSDGGLTWSKPRPVIYGDSNFRLPSGDQIILPYNLYPAPENTVTGPYQICRKGERELRVVKEGLKVTGWPRADKPDPKRGVSGFVFNGGGVKLKDGNFLATLYGYFKDTKRCSLVAADSKDGAGWKIRTIIADENCKLQGPDGPTEAATCRLKDGRLMCIFRLGAGFPYGQVFSDDEGKTWTEPVAMKEVFSVQPCLQVLKNGAVVLSGGRPGLFLWINREGDGKKWQRVDMRANHNACQPDDAITKVTTEGDSNTTAYTRIVQTGDNELLYVYDRIPNGWRGLPKDSPATNSVWVMQVRLQFE